VVGRQTAPPTRRPKAVGRWLRPPQSASQAALRPGSPSGSRSATCEAAARTSTTGIEGGRGGAAGVGKRPSRATFGERRGVRLPDGGKRPEVPALEATRDVCRRSGSQRPTALRRRLARDVCRAGRRVCPLHPLSAAGDVAPAPRNPQRHRAGAPRTPSAAAPPRPLRGQVDSPEHNRVKLTLSLRRQSRGGRTRSACRSTRVGASGHRPGPAASAGGGSQRSETHRGAGRCAGPRAYWGCRTADG
jgi:hypothetical protein